VEIKDETHFCPLCHCVLEQGENDKDTYPDVRFKTKRLMLVARIYLFVAIIVSALLILVNHTFYHGVWWCAIVIAGLAYVYLTLHFAILNDAGYRMKIVVLTIFAILTVILIDVVMGYRGWSVNYVIPGTVLLIDLGILILMIVNARNWQSYLLFQIGVILFSLIPLFLWKIKLLTDPLLSQIAFGASVFLFLGTVIIGDRRARIELKRRFHVR
jgi:hypothetical protein